jgi:hypothetical protein
LTRQSQDPNCPKDQKQSAQGDNYIHHLPKALPWAKGLLAFQAVMMKNLPQNQRKHISTRFYQPNFRNKKNAYKTKIPPFLAGFF